MSRRRPTSLAAVLATAAVASAGCGGSSGAAAGPGGSGGEPAASARVAIKGYKFHPASVTVRAGGTVTFANADSSKHTATAKDAGDQSFFDTDGLAKGERRRITFTRPGTYAYICAYHPFMHGTVVVR